jgi:hypothetical protein
LWLFSLGMALALLPIPSCFVEESLTATRPTARHLRSSSSPLTVQAFDKLMSHHMLNGADERALLDVLPFEAQCGEDAKLVSTHTAPDKERGQAQAHAPLHPFRPSRRVPRPWRGMNSVCACARRRHGITKHQQPVARWCFWSHTPISPGRSDTCTQQSSRSMYRQRRTRPLCHQLSTARSP